MTENTVEVTQEEIENKSLTLYEQASNLVIKDQESYAAAGEVGKALKALEKQITDFFEPMRVKAKEAYDMVLAKKNEELAPVAEAMAMVRKTMNVFVQEQERIRQERERKLREEEQERARKERERLEKQAAKAEEKGQDEKAEDLREKAEQTYAAPVTVAPTIDKNVKTSAGNIVQSKEIKVEVTDMKAFLRAIVEQNVNPTMVSIGAGPLKAWVKANGLENFPGLHIERTVGVRL